MTERRAASDHLRWRDTGRLLRLLRFAVLRIPGVDLALRGFDFFVSNLLHHYMETGTLAGIRARGARGSHELTKLAVVAGTCAEFAGHRAFTRWCGETSRRPPRPIHDRRSGIRP